METMGTDDLLFWMQVEDAFVEPETTTQTAERCRNAVEALRYATETPEDEG